jgi:hypothetical protein
MIICFESSLKINNQTLFTMIKCKKDKVLVKARQKMAKRHILNSEKTNINHLYLEKIVQFMQQKIV